MRDIESTPQSVNATRTLPILSASRSLSEGDYATAPTPAPRPELFGATDRGRRRDRNEDQFAVAELSRQLNLRSASIDAGTLGNNSSTQGLLLAVADGMGGHGGGDIASAVAVDAFLQYAAFLGAWPANTGVDERDDVAIKGELASAVEACQMRLWQVVARKKIANQQPGTTLTAAYVLWPKAYLAHVGDTRCYLMRDGALTLLTHDHTVAQRIEDADHDASPPAAFSHLLSNAIGGGTSELEPDISHHELAPGDALLLCSDGLTRMVDDIEITRLLATAPSAQAACESLLRAANDAGGDDNITAVVARF